MGEGITGYVVQTGDSLVVPNIAEEPAFLDRTGARGTWIRRVSPSSAYR